MLTRRRLVALLPGAAAGMHVRLHGQSRLFARKPKPHAAASQPMVYFGTETSAKGGSKGIYGARFDAAKGHFSEPALMAACVGPSFLAAGQVRDRRLLYAVNEGDGRTSGVSTYAIDAASGALKQLGQVPSGGAGPAYLSLSASGRTAFVANYMGGTVASFAVQPDGTLTQPVQAVDLRKLHRHGPVADRQDGSHPHSAMLSPDNRFLLVNDLGLDVIAVFPVDASTGQMGTVRLTEVRVAGSGPRHVAFHPNGRWVYGVDELSSKIDQYLWNEVHAAGGIAAQALLTDTAHSVGTIDPNFHGPANTAAEIVVSPDGHFVYASNRGENSVVTFTVNETSGALTFAQRTACGGRGPRHITLDPSGRWMIVSNQDSGGVAVLARDPANGQLSGPVQSIAVPEAVFALFL